MESNTSGAQSSCADAPQSISIPAEILRNIRLTAVRFGQRWGKNHIEEMISIGNLVAVEKAAANNWNPERQEFWPWIRKRVEGAMIDYLQSISHRNECGLVEMPDHKDENCTPFELVRRNQIERRKRAAIIELPVRDQFVIQRLEDGAREVDIARELNISQPRVVQIKQRAVRKIRPHVAVAQIAA